LVKDTVALIDRYGHFSASLVVGDGVPSANVNGEAFIARDSSATPQLSSSEHRRDLEGKLPWLDSTSSGLCKDPAHITWRKILGPYRQCAGAVQLRDARVVSRRALAIGRFGRSRWLLAADAVELWELLASWSVRRRDCQPGAGSEEWRCSNNGAEWVDVARVGGGLKPLIGVGRRGGTH